MPYDVLSPQDREKVFSFNNDEVPSGFDKRWHDDPTELVYARDDKPTPQVDPEKNEKLYTGIFVAKPRYDGTSYSDGDDVLQEERFGLLQKGYVLHWGKADFSCLTLNFNRLWADCLNYRRSCNIKYWIMKHADVVPMYSAAIRKLIIAKEKTGASVVSAVIPIKSEKGLTSTGVFWPLGPDDLTVRRLTMKEVFKLPPQFTIKDVREILGWKDAHSLALNTGFWLADMTEKWCEMVFFSNKDAINFNTDTERYSASIVSEDWSFSAILDMLRVPVAASWDIPINHYGQQRFPSDIPWGNWEVDEDFIEKHKTRLGKDCPR